MKPALLTFFILVSIVAFAGQRKYITIGRQVDSFDFSVDSSSIELAVEARAAFDFGKGGPEKSSCYWGMSWNRDRSGGFYYVAVRLKNTDFGNITDERVAEIEYGRCISGNDSIIVSGILKSGHNVKGGENSLSIEWFDGRMRIFFGDKALAQVMDIHAQLPVNGGFRVFSSGKLGLKTIVVENIVNMANVLATDYSVEELLTHFNESADSLEGLWTYLDRVTDDNRARLGGIYNVGIIKDGNNYKILYLSGAKVNADRWNPMMVKGELSPTPFVGHFDLKWYDAMMNEMEDECNASLDSEGILTFSFPIHKSSLRFYRKMN